MSNLVDITDVAPPVFGGGWQHMVVTTDYFEEPAFFMKFGICCRQAGIASAFRFERRHPYDTLQDDGIAPQMPRTWPRNQRCA